MSLFPWIVGGGAIAYAVSRSHEHHPLAASSPPTPTLLPGTWVWPVARWNGRAPVISDGFGSPRPGGIQHGGVDVMFARLPSDPFKPKTPNGAAHHVMPDGIHALAASDGAVWSAMKTPRGFAVVLDHGPRKVATFYTHLESLIVKPTAKASSGERVRAGQPIGVIGSDPLDPEHLKHLHFEVWLGGPNDRVDPSPLMHDWETISDSNASTLVARNGGFAYRPVGATGEPYPDWVRVLDGKAGVYVIRDRDTRETVYVGSSATQLYATLTRHFQTWRRWKGFWRGQYGEGHDPGLTYPRDSVEVAVRITTPSRCLDEEMRLIRKLKPRDNVIGQTDRVVEEEVPF